MREQETKSLCRVGVVGDIHAEDEYLKASIAFFHKKDIKHILCVGDIVDGRGDPNECCQMLIQHNIPTIMGNHDSWVLENSMRDVADATKLEDLNDESVEYLGGLQKSLSFNTPVGKLLLCHGVANNNMARIKPNDTGYAIESNIDLQSMLAIRKYKFMINGHTHKRMVKKIEYLIVINA